MSDDIDLLDLRIVRTIADTGSITAAAAVLGYSQPAVTQRLRRVETTLRQPLVVRAGRGIALTEAGRRLARHAVFVQSAVDAAVDELAELRGVAMGTIRLAGFPSASPTLVPALLSSLRASHPGLTVTYVEAEPPEALDLLRAGRIDLAVTFAFPGDDRDTGDAAVDGIVETPLFTDTSLLVAPTGSFADDDSEGSGTSPVHLEDFAAASFIGGCPRCRGHLLATCRRAGFEPHLVFETDNALAVTRLVASGLGVALLPSLSLVSTGLPDGVEARAVPVTGDRVVQIAHATGSERIPAVAAALRAVTMLDPSPFGLRPVHEPVGARG